MTKKKLVEAIKSVEQRDLDSTDIRKYYNEVEGLWHVAVFVMDQWVDVATHCEEYEANDCLNDLCRWKRSE